ncbi:MAG: NAD-dependent epimerase/dehydratase family protein [Candidatus Omnitrophica bacterium]|nr:NAD-dependent epimerase/dehydratase family protein [Candidatus Omnitrophota bacterium]
MTPRGGAPARIVVTGGAGFLGSHLCERLLADGHRVVALDMAPPTKVRHLLAHPKFRFLRGSVLDTPLVTRALRGCDIAFHFAAIADPKRYVEEPLATLDIDLAGALLVIRLAARAHAKLILASTSEVYGRNPRVPWREDADRVLGPPAINRWCYATAKAAAEHYCLAYHQQRGLSFVTVRLFNVYGPRLDDLGMGRVAPLMLHAMLHGQPVLIHGDGRQTRSFAYVTDVVDGIVRVAFTRAAENQTFNVGSGEEISIRRLAALMAEVGGFTPRIRMVPYRRAFGASYEDIPRRVPDTSKIRRVTGWEATTPLRDGLRRTIDYYRTRMRAGHD